MKRYPLVSIVILNYNGQRYLGELLKQFLDSIFETDYPSFEVVFVDNGSTDRSIDFVTKYFNDAKLRGIANETTIIESKCNVIGVGYNKGIQASKGKYVALVSNDMIFEKNWLRKIVDEMENNPLTGIAGCKRLVLGASNVIDGLGGDICIDGRAFIPGNLEIDRGQYTTIRDMDWIGGAAVISRLVLQKIGLFDEDYIIFYEDTDLCYRARKMGYSVVCIPSALLWHKGTTTISSALPSRYTQFMGERSRIRFVLIHFSLRKVFATFLIDGVGWLLSGPQWKRILLSAYWSNLKCVGTTLKRRLKYGPSPPYGCKYPVINYNLSNISKKLRERLGISFGQ